jgi:1,4-alpha-glucan branching enzyme
MIGKMPGDLWQKHANLRALYGYMYGHPGKKLLFMGSEIGQWNEWNYDTSLDWHLLEYKEHAGLRRWIQDLNETYRREASLHQMDFEPAGFSWIDCNDNENSVISMIRRARDPQDFTVMVANFTPVPRLAYRIGVPEAGWYRELLNSDADIYGGANMGNGGGVMAEEVPAHGFRYSLTVATPPLGFVLFKR